jgi:hypothetical protein
MSYFFKTLVLLPLPELLLSFSLSSGGGGLAGVFRGIGWLSVSWLGSSFGSSGWCFVFAHLIFCLRFNCLLYWWYLYQNKFGARNSGNLGKIPRKIYSGFEWSRNYEN